MKTMRSGGTLGVMAVKKKLGKNQARAKQSNRSGQVGSVKKHNKAGGRNGRPNAKPSALSRKSAQKPKKTASADVIENIQRAKIRVIGIGGGGGNIVTEVADRVQRLDFFGANTDNQALRELPKRIKTFSFGQDFTNGLGCGMDAELGERAAKAEKEKIKKMLEGSDICVFIASLGGGTGSGASPVFAEAAHELRILTVGIFTMPFSFEGDRRRQIAEASLDKIKPYLNTYVVIPNENIFRVIDSKTPLKVALSEVNKKLAVTLEGFIETLSSAGLINIDFADVRSVLEGRGRLGFINAAEGGGATKVQDVIKHSLSNPLYEYGIDGADRMLFNIVGDRNLKMQEVAQVSKAISDYNPKARIIFGVACNNIKLKDKIRVTLFAIGCGGGNGENNADEHQDKQTKQSKKSQQKKKEKKLVVRVKRAKVQEDNDGSGGISKEDLPDNREEQRVRRNAIDVKKAVDEELQELEKKEREWDVPAFLRNK